MATRPKEEGLGTGQTDEARELARQVDNLRNDLAELGSTVRALAQEGSASAQRSVREVARKGQDLGQQAVEYGSEMFKEKYSEFESTVRRNPTTSVIVALGLGYIAGLLSRNRS